MACPPPLQKSARAVYGASLAHVDYNDNSGAICVSIYPVCKCFVPEAILLRCQRPETNASITNMLKKVLQNGSRAFLFQHTQYTIQGKFLCR